MNSVKKIKVLIAEDDYLVAQEISNALNKIGYENIGTATNGKMAVKMAGSLKPDVVLMDIKMPELDGFEATKAIQEQYKIPVVILTAYESKEFLDKTKNMGIYAYLLKPPVPSEIERNISIALARHNDLIELNRLNENLQSEIIKRKIIEIRLQESEERFRTIFETARDSIFIKDTTLKYTLVNPAMERLFGLPSSKIIGFTDEILFGKDEVAHIMEIDSRVLNREVIEEEHNKLVKGVLITFHIIKVPMQNKSGEIVGLCGIARDITERKQAEKALRKSEVKYRNLVEKLEEGIASTDENENFIFVNQATAKIFGYSIEELLKKNLKELITAEGFQQILKQTSIRKTGKSSKYELEIISQDDSKRNILVTSSPTFDSSGKYKGAFGIFSDITERKQAEEALQQKTIELQERNEDLDSFAHTVAHDLKNPLGIVFGFADLLNEDYSKFSEDDIRKYLRMILNDSYKILRIIDGLLMFASLRKTEINTEIVNMDDIVAEAIKQLSQIIEKNNAEITFPDTMPAAFGSTHLVEEVWSNYINNAIKYGGTPPRVEIGADTEKSKNVPEGMVRFWVRDNGSGISPENQKLLFKKFERLDQVQTKGYGLGLSIVRRIIEKLGGQVGVESEPGKGSVFYFTLPAKEKKYPTEKEVLI